MTAPVISATSSGTAAVNRDSYLGMYQDGLMLNADQKTCRCMPGVKFPFHHMHVAQFM